MTFLPEFLTGCLNLNTNLPFPLPLNPTTNPNPTLTTSNGNGNPMLLWIYLVFLNSLFVVFPVWVLREARGGFRGVFGGGMNGMKG